MRFISKKETAKRVLYSEGHIMRLVRAGKFPRPVKQNGFRVSFIDDEITVYQKEKVAERDRQPGAAA